MTDRETGYTYPVRVFGYEIFTDRATLRGRVLQRYATDTAVTFTEEADGFRVTSTYRLCGETAFFEKTIALDAPTPFTVEHVVCERMAFDTAFERIFLHDDQSLWHCPENYFFETPNGGLCMGLCYPDWDTSLTADGTVTLGYTLGYRAEGHLSLEPTFCGVFRKEGVKRYSHGPYPGKKPMPYFPGFPEESGLHQHFRDHIIPDDAGIEPEILDWGAVWAMQSYMKYRLPRLRRLHGTSFCGYRGHAGQSEPPLLGV